MLRPWFTKCLANAMRKYNEHLHDEKQEFFDGLRTIESGDPVLRREGKFRLLEIGSGTGVNLKYYPKNAQLILLDPNPLMEQYLGKSISDAGGAEVERFVVAKAEGMTEKIPENSVDVVVSSLVLCSVDDVQKVLTEVAKVLRPGGHFYFWEHITAANRGLGTWVLQTLGFWWKWIPEGCDMQRDSGRLIAAHAGFENVDVEEFTIDYPSPLCKFGLFFPVMCTCIRFHVRGVATKKAISYGQKDKLL